MANRKIAVFALAALSLAALAACGETETNSSSQSEEQVSSSENVSSQTPSSSKPAGRSAVLTLTHTSLRAGMSFLDAAGPNTVYTNTSGVATDKGSAGTFTIRKDGDAETVYEPDQPLPAGKYTVTNKLSVEGGHKVVTPAVELSVTEGTIDQDKGVDKSATLEQMEPYKFMNYSGLDTLGVGGQASGCMPSVGNSRVLVIPVEFANTSFAGMGVTDANAIKEAQDEARAIMQEGFFAENDKTAAPVDGKVPDTTPWESLHSYYKKASGGLLNITGAVAPVYKYNIADNDPRVGSPCTTIANAAIKQYTEQKTIIDGKPFDPKDYDSDGDGFIDGVEMIYVTYNGTPSDDDSGKNDTWWNYTTYTGNAPDRNSPKAKRIFFSRWDYTINAYYTGAEYDAYGSRFEGKAIDAHTIIHETGHMMGAPDYYSYDHKEGAAGCVDMMDNNVGDHNAYTKMAYGWVAPWVVDYTSNDFEITLPSYTETRNFLLVPGLNKTWNGTPWDEYVMFEYYTPTGVNEADSSGYAEWTMSTNYGHGGTYDRPGLQVFHVDTRASSFTRKAGETVKVRNYTDTPRPADTTLDNGDWESWAQSVHSNTPAGTDGRQGSISGVTGRGTNIREMQAVFAGDQNSLNSSTYYSSFGNIVNLFGLQSYYEDPNGDGEKEYTYGDGSNTHYGSEYYSPSRARNWFLEANEAGEMIYGSTKLNNGSEFPWSISITAQTDTSITLHFVNNLSL